MLRILPLVLTLFLTGCSGLITTEPAPESLASNIPWTLQQQQMLALENWRLQGKIGIRTTSDSHSASLYWQQVKQHYDIELTGPLGQGGARIEGNGEGITVDLAGEEPIWAASPEHLMEQTLGWQFPVRELLYWIKGIPAPNQPFQLQLNQELPEKITQKDWEINYLRFTNLNGLQVPGKLTISRNDLRITIVAKQWLIQH